MVKVYIAGPYSADNVMNVLHNIRKGIEMSYRVFAEGMAPFCPWLDYQYVLMDKDRKLTVQDFYDYSIAWLLVSDAVLVLEGWSTSKGTIREIEIAKENNIPVFYSFNGLMIWKQTI